MSYKIAIFTAIFGGKDELKEPINYKSDENVDYFLITDEPNIESKCYHVIYKKPIYNDLTKNARYYKIIGLDLFNEYEYVIWHDANLQIVHDEILKVIKFVKYTGIAFFKHSDRNCIYDEAIKCIQLEKDYPSKILLQIYGYFLYGIKNETGLYETSIVVKNTKLICKDFLDLWWSEIKNKSRRDQLSLPYSLKKFNIEPGIIDGRRAKNNYTFFSLHNNPKYNFLSLKKPKPYNRWSKAIAIKIILFFKKINFNGIL